MTKISKGSENPQKDLENLQTGLNWVLIAGVVVILIPLVFYFSHFHNQLAIEQEKWGQFGDFIGGLSNPLLGFFGLIALLFTIRIQLKELKETRKDLELTRNEIKQNKEISLRQAEHFENQALKEDYMRLISMLDQELDNLTKKEVVGFTIGRTILTKTLNDWFGSSQYNMSIYSQIPEVDNDEIIKSGHPQICDLNLKFSMIDYYMKKFAKKFEPKTEIHGVHILTDFYYLKYSVLVVQAANKGYLSKKLAESWYQRTGANFQYKNHLNDQE